MYGAMSNGEGSMLKDESSSIIPSPDGHIAAQLQCPAVAEVNSKTVRQKAMVHKSLAPMDWMNRAPMPD